MTGRTIMLIIAIGGPGLAAGSAAIVGGGFEVNRYTIDGGGGTSAAGAFEVSGTIGQPDAGGVMTGGVYAVRGGFWVGGGAAAPSCPADLNGSGTVDAADLAVLLGAWGPNPGQPADLDGSGVVDAADLAMLLGAWGACS